MRTALVILIVIAALVLGFGGVMAWWLVTNDWYDKGMMDD